MKYIRILWTRWNLVCPALCMSQLHLLILPTFIFFISFFPKAFLLNWPRHRLKCILETICGIHSTWFSILHLGWLTILYFFPEKTSNTKISYIMLFNFPSALCLSTENRKITLLSLKSIQVDSEFKKLINQASHCLSFLQHCQIASVRTNAESSSITISDLPGISRNWGIQCRLSNVNYLEHLLVKYQNIELLFKKGGIYGGPEKCWEIKSSLTGKISRRRRCDYLSHWW